MQKYVSFDITEQTYADRQTDNILAVFLLGELQKAVQLQNREASPEATINMVTADEAEFWLFYGFLCFFGTHCHSVLS